VKLLRKAWFWAVIAAVAVALGLVVWQRWRGPKVSVAAVQRREIVQTLVVSGRVLPPARINVGSLVSGVARTLGAREGDHVQAGDLLVQLDDAELRASLAQAEAGLAVARARLQQSRTVNARVAGEAHRQADVNLESAELGYQRSLALFRGGGISQAELDEARRAHDIARSQHESTEAQVKAVGPGGADHQAAVASVAQAAAGVAVAQVRLGEAKITAPTAARVLSRAVEQGELVAVGRALFVLAQDGPTELVIEPDEKNLRSLALGQKARASADAFPQESFAAEISYIAPAVDPQRGTIELRLTVPAPPAYLKPDMTVSVDAELGRRPDALVVPADALHDVGTPGPWVFVVKGDLLERRDVKLGLRGDGIVELGAGVAEGEIVALAGAGELAAGARIRPVLKEK
jgi:HlyD family secretion protein